MTNSPQPLPTITCAQAINTEWLAEACRDKAPQVVTPHVADLRPGDVVSGVVTGASSSETVIKDRRFDMAIIGDNTSGSKWRTVEFRTNISGDVASGEYSFDTAIVRFPINEADDALAGATVTRVTGTDLSSQAFKVRRVIGKLMDCVTSMDEAKAAFAAKVVESGAADAIRWNASGTVAAEAQGNLAAQWMGALADPSNADRDALDLVARCMAQTADRLLFNSADDTWSGRFSNDAVRSADDARRALLRDLKWYVPFGTVLAAG